MSVSFSQPNPRFLSELTGISRSEITVTCAMNEDLPLPRCELRRLPGLFRRWELSQVLEAGEDYRIEDAGLAEDGTQLFAVYKNISIAQEYMEAM
jgi:hypothetical protein